MELNSDVFVLQGDGVYQTAVLVQLSFVGFLGPVHGLEGAGQLNDEELPLPVFYEAQKDIWAIGVLKVFGELRREILFAIQTWEVYPELETFFF